MAIHTCRHCGAILPYDDSRICPNCARKREAEKRQGPDSTVNTAGAGCLAALAGPLLKFLKIFGVFLVFCAVIWVILFFVFDAYKIDYTVVGESTRTVEEFEAFLLDFESKRDVWEIQYEKKGSGIFGRLSSGSNGSYTMRYNKGETASHITFIFDGENLGTELPDGTYILTKIDGADVLVDENSKLIYKADSEFYTTNAPKLQAITHDVLLSEILEKTEGGEHGLVETDPPMEAIFTEKAAITARLVRNDPDVLMDHGFEARCNTSDSDEWDVYKFTYYYQNSVRDLKIDGYTYAK